jgi:hypothetical protein
LKVNDVSQEYIAPIFKVDASLASVFTLLSCSAYSSTLKMVATFSSETSVEF